MDNFLVALMAVLPLCVQMALGYGARSLKLINEKTADQMNNVVFKIFLPIMLFINIYKTKIEDIFNPFLMLYAALAVLAAFFLAWGFVAVTQKDTQSKSVMIQGMFRSNFILFGLPLTISLHGQEAAGITSLLTAIIVPCFNILAVFILEFYKGGKVYFKSVLLGIVKNPLIISSALGLLLVLLNISLPEFIISILSTLANVATPLALFVLGASFAFSSVKGNEKKLFTTLFVKLIAVPLVFLTIAILLGFRNGELSSLVALFASPVAVSSFTMASQMGGDKNLSSQIVVIGSVCSIFTVFLFIFVLKSLSFL
ncbi:MAG: AEC family transporter [Oscillospiraceae bacterium]